MGAFLLKYKGYIIHGAAMAVVFLTPSVQHAIAANPGYALLGGTVWGWVLHWAQGK